ncbi:acrosomal protein KIAA1210 homolog isoform X2 [Pelobates fuscus]
MAANSAEGPQTSETEEAHEENTGKKKSKFQAFKKFFVKKKRKEYPTPSRETNLKPSQSSSDVSVSAVSTTALPAAQEPGPKSNMGNKALSHDSVFQSETENIAKDKSSQENIPGKVKSLQLQLEQNIRIGSSPRGIVPKNIEDSGALSEDDGLPRSPPEINSLHEILAESSAKSSSCTQRRSSLSLGGTDSEEEQVSSCPRSPLSSVLSCPTSPSSRLHLLDFTEPASSLICLDNSAAKHRIAVKPKNQRGPTVKLKQTASVQPKGTSVKGKVDTEEPELDSEHAKFNTEDIAVRISVVDAKPLLDLKEIEDTKGNGKNEGPFVSLTLESEDKQVPKSEAAQYEANVDFHISQTPEEDQVEYIAEATEKREESDPTTESIFTIPVYELDAVLDMAELPETTDLKEEIVDRDISPNQTCEMVDTSPKIDENLSVIVTDEPIINEFKQQLELEPLETCFSGTQCKLNVNTERTLNLEETSLLKDDLLEQECITATCSSDQSTESCEPSCGILMVHDVLSDVVESQEILECKETHVCAEHSESDHVSPNTDNESSAMQFSGELVCENEVVHLDEGVTESPMEKTENLLVESATEISTSDSCSVQVASGTVGKELDVLSCTDPLTETYEECKKTETNLESKQKSAAKPVRFTVAPAWQRSLSVASPKEFAFRNILKSGSFDSAEETVITIHKDESRKTDKLTDIPPKSDEESLVPFGVRLRSTSTPLKYSEAHFGESVKPSTVDTLHLDLKQNTPKPTKTAQIRSDATKESKPLHTNENRTPLKPKADDPSLKEIIAPSWISVAKQKRKGFQEHPLAREENITAENNQAKGALEISLKISNDSKTQSEEIKPKKELQCIDIYPAESIDIRPGPEKFPASLQNPDEPPWLSLAKKKAKAWSEMPPITQ